MNILSCLPTPKGHSTLPEWNGQYFICEDKIYPFLDYSCNESGWSGDLTDLHEEYAADVHPIDKASRRNAVKQIQACKPLSHATFLDVGCSSGFLIQDLRLAFPEALILGADAVQSSLAQVAHAQLHVPLMLFDMTQCPLPPESIDILIMLNVLEHIEKDHLAVENAFKILKPGGHLIIEVPAGPFLFNNYDRTLRHFRRYSSKGLTSLIRHPGFEILRITHLGFFLFPAFAATKIFQKYFHRDRVSFSEVKASLSLTKESKILDYSLILEERYLSKISLPFGIRLLLTAKKPIAHDAQA